MTLTDEELVTTLGELKYLPVEKLEQAQAVAKRDHGSLHDILIRDNYLPKDELDKVVAYHFQLPYISLRAINIPDTLLNILPEATAKQFQAVAYQLDEGGLHIATSQPAATDLFGMLAKKAGATKYLAAYASDDDIAAALHLFKQNLQNVFDNLLAGGRASAPPVAELVDLIFDYALDAQASDVHIEPLHDQTIIRFRVDGVLHDEVHIPKPLHDQIISRLKVLSKLRTDEHLSAQDGRLRVTVRQQDIAVRISVVPLVTGEQVVMRLLSRQKHQFSLAELGMSSDDLGLVREGFTRPFGMILSTGPTGSGKTTTIYSILKILNVRDRNIATIEDPVEYELEGVNQTQVNPKTNLTFDAGLRSLLRQDPDVLFVGEIRDRETAAITVNAAMTGHLVLSTMHTNDAATTLPRLVDMGIEPYLVASTVNIIIGQRLVRQICSHCKVSVKLTHTPQGWQGDPAQAVLLGSISRSAFLRHFGNKAVVRVYKGNGCSACHGTGYQGRVGIFEVLEVTPKLAQLISTKVDSDKLLEQAVHDGMVTMLDDGLDKVIAGVTTLSEIMRVTKV